MYVLYIFRYVDTTVGNLMHIINYIDKSSQVHTISFSISQ